MVYNALTMSPVLHIIPIRRQGEIACNAMNPFHADDEENADRIDVGAIARTGMLIGANLALAGVLGQHPVIKSMIEFSSIEPALTPAQTLAVGLALIFGSV